MKSDKSDVIVPIGYRYNDNISDRNSFIIGWLIFTNTMRKGKSITLTKIKSTIGTGAKYDIDISYDSSSDICNAEIEFDCLKSKTYIINKNNNSIYQNGKKILVKTPLVDYDLIEIGNCSFIFRSLCNESFSWANLV